MNAVRPLVVALLLASGCGGSSTPPTPRAGSADSADSADGGQATPPTSVPEDPKARRQELYEALRASIDGADCPTYATRVSAWLAANTAEIRRLEQTIEDPADVDEPLVDVFEVLLDLASDCVDDDGAQAAFDAFDDLFIGG